MLGKLADVHEETRIPVVDEGRLGGIISIRDIIKFRLDEVQAEADAMRTYIAG